MLMEHKNTPNTIKNPLLDYREDITTIPFQQLSFFEKIGLICAFVISFLILVISSFSLYVDFFIKSSYIYSLIDLFVILICLGAVYFLFKTFKKRIITDILIDTAFQEGVYAKLHPLIENIARSHIDTNIILDRLNNMDLKVQNILKQGYTRDKIASDFMEEPIAVGTSIKFAIKTIFLLSITMAVFIFFLNFPLYNLTKYAVLLIFIMWWVFITNEYGLWKNSVAWGMVFFPILVVPVLFMLIEFIVASNLILAMVYVAIGFYVFFYYLWALYATTGSLPFIGTKKREPETSEFFALQNKGMIREISDFALSRIKNRLKEDMTKQESKYVWKK